VAVFAATERGPWGAAQPRLSAYEATSGSNGSLGLCISAAPAYDGPPGNRNEILRRSVSKDTSDSSRGDNDGDGGCNDDEYGLGKAYSDVETTACPPHQGAPLPQVESQPLQGANQRPPLPLLILCNSVAYCFDLGCIFLNSDIFSHCAQAAAVSAFSDTTCLPSAAAWQSLQQQHQQLQQQMQQHLQQQNLLQFLQQQQLQQHLQQAQQQLLLQLFPQSHQHQQLSQLQQYLQQQQQRSPAAAVQEQQQQLQFKQQQHAAPVQLTLQAQLQNKLQTQLFQAQQQQQQQLPYQQQLHLQQQLQQRQQQQQNLLFDMRARALRQAEMQQQVTV
jgi:hypothetical protein